LVLLVSSLLVTGAIVFFAGTLFAPSIDVAQWRLGTAQERLSGDSAHRQMNADQRLKAERWDVLIAQGMSGETAQAQVEYEFASIPRGCEASEGHMSALRAGIPIPDPLDPRTMKATYRCADWLAENSEVFLQWQKASQEYLRAVEVAKRGLARAEFTRGLLLWGGGVVSTLLWLTAFLSVWWWLGARAKMRETT
jgi:hypothetical protein